MRTNIVAHGVAVGLICLIPVFQGCGGGGGGGSPPPITPAPQTSFTISGTITNGAGAVVSATGPDAKSITADASGAFSISGLRAGSYTVSATLPGSVFSPSELTVHLTTANATGVQIQAREPSEGLSEEELERLEQLPDSPASPDEIMLPNGLSLNDYVGSRGYTLDTIPSDDVSQPSGTMKDTNIGLEAQSFEAVGADKLNDVIMKIIGSAKRYACGRADTPCSTWDFSADAQDPALKPAQTGLTYVYGGRTPNVRTKPKDSCKEMTHGVDCSGLVARVAAAAGITAPTAEANVQATGNGWGIPAEWGLQLSKVTDGSIQPGDFVFWNKHAGIATNASHVISATGGPNLCDKNIKPKKGPRELTFAGLGKGAPTTVLRIELKPAPPACASTAYWESAFRYAITQNNGVSDNEVVSVGGGRGSNSVFLDLTSGSPPRLRLRTGASLDAHSVSLWVRTTAPYQPNVQTYQLEAPGAELWNSSNIEGCLSAQFVPSSFQRRGCFQFSGTLNIVSKTPICTENNLLYSTLEVGYEGSSPLKPYGSTSLGPVIVDRGYARGVFVECAKGTPTPINAWSEAFTCTPESPTSVAFEQ